MSKIGPALIAGNAVVVKPPTQGCVAGLHMAHYFLKAGVPPGLVNVVTGRGSEIGDYLTAHEGANCVSFTGGDTGLSVARKARMVPLQMELGGKDACLVFPDADVDLAAKSIVKGGFSYAGQRCTAVKIVVAFEDVADELVEKTCEGIAKLKVGQPEENADITAVVSAKSADYIQDLWRTRWRRGEDAQPWRREDNLVWPALVDGVTPEMRLCWEEPFGPIVPVVRVKTEEEAPAVRQREQVRAAGMRLHAGRQNGRCEWRMIRRRRGRCRSTDRRREDRIISRSRASRTAASGARGSPTRSR